LNRLAEMHRPFHHSDVIPLGMIFLGLVSCEKTEAPVAGTSLTPPQHESRPVAKVPPPRIEVVFSDSYLRPKEE
jgi:hypothetical protein